MIILYNPRSTAPPSRRFPLSLLAIGAMLHDDAYEIVDGNAHNDPYRVMADLIRTKPVEVVGVTVMPGPQLQQAVPVCRRLKAEFSHVTIVWGGYFPSLYTDAALRADYVDFAVRGQGEETFTALIETLRKGGSLADIPGLSYKEDGRIRHTPERVWKGPDAFPVYPYHKIDAPKYILPSFLGARTAVHQASIGCPYSCNFCGVITAYGSKEKMESPERTVNTLRFLKERYGVDAIQFYDNNFFVGERHAAELCERMTPLAFNWWCEARIDALLRYSDATWKKIRDSGCRMIFTGAESGSDWVLRQMSKRLSTGQTLELAARAKQWSIIPEFSFVLGNPQDPERDIVETTAFIRRLKTVNPDCEIILYHYTPTPQRNGSYGDVEDRFAFPETLEEWTSDPWYRFSIRSDPGTPWLKPRWKRRIENFETVLRARYPTVQDRKLTPSVRKALRLLSDWRYRSGVHLLPLELKLAFRLISLRNPKSESL